MWPFTDKKKNNESAKRMREMMSGPALVYSDGTIEPLLQFIPQLQESMDLLDKTLNPDTYFSRYEYAEGLAKKLCGVKQAKINGKSADRIYAELIGNKDKNHKAFIDRVFDKRSKYISNLDSNKDKMSKAAWEYYKSKQSGRRYHFAAVSFGDSWKTYDYLCEDMSVKAGNKVEVETKDGIQVVEVKKTFYLYESELSFPIDRYKKILRKR